MSENNDALMYAYIKNVLSITDLDKFSNVDISLDGSMSKSEAISKILSETTRKRACCMAKSPSGRPNVYQIDVRIPIPEKNKVYTPNDVGVDSKIKNTFQFTDKTVFFPEEACEKDTTDAYIPRNDNCERFMHTYCTTMNELYRQQVKALGKDYDPVEFANFKPECACYADIPQAVKDINVDKACLVTKECRNGENVYQNNKLYGKSCPSNICSVMINQTDFTAGHDIAAQNYVTQKCSNGNEVEIDKKKISDNTASLTSNPTDTTTGKPADTTTGKPADTTTGKPADTTTGKPADTTTGKPADTTTGKPADTTTGKPADTTTGKPADTTTEETTGIGKYFSAEGNYLGYGVLCVCCLLLCSSSVGSVIALKK
jgi:hypothetical protein